MAKKRTKSEAQERAAGEPTGHSIPSAVRGEEPAGEPEDKEAVAALRRSIRLNGNIAQSHELLGKFLSREGRLAEAAKHLESAMHLEPANESAMYQLAQVYSKQGNAARAQPLFAKVKEIKTEQRENFTKGRLQQILRADSPAR